MKLYEYEAKALIAAVGVGTPIGSLWSAPDPGRRFPVAVKAQVLEGGRGKRGGVRFAATSEELQEAVRDLNHGTADLRAADALLVEEKLTVERELYLAFTVDRSVPGGVSLVAAPRGGVDVEEVAKVTRLVIPLFLWHQQVPRFAIHDVARLWKLPIDTRFETLLNALWQLFREQDCLLLEINPLALVDGGAMVALDARIEVDDAARFRHPEWQVRQEGTPFEIECRRYGAVAAQMAGEVAIITSGAGLGMATLDLVGSVGARAACLVDLGGSVFQPSGRVRRIVQQVCDLRPDVILVNGYLQLASWEALATEIAEGMRGRLASTRVVVRCAGNEQEPARRILEGQGATVTADLREAFEMIPAVGVGRPTPTVQGVP